MDGIRIQVRWPKVSEDVKDPDPNPNSMLDISWSLLGVL